MSRGSANLILAGDQSDRGIIGGSDGHGHPFLIVAAVRVPIRLDFGADQLHAVGAHDDGRLEQRLGALIARQRFIPAGPEELDQGHLLVRPFGREIFPRCIGPVQAHQAAAKEVANLGP